MMVFRLMELMEYVSAGRSPGASPTGGRGVRIPALLKTAGDDPQKFGYFGIFFLET